MFKSPASCFLSCLCHDSTTFSNWSVDCRCFWHPRRESVCLTVWLFLKEQMGMKWSGGSQCVWTQASLFAVCATRDYGRGPSSTQCPIPTFLFVFVVFFFFFILNWESCKWTESCKRRISLWWKPLVFIPWVDSGRRFGILIHIQRSPWREGPENGIKFHTLYSFLFVMCMYI